MPPCSHRLWRRDPNQTASGKPGRFTTDGGAWIMGLIERKKPEAAAVLLANKTAWIPWVLTRQEIFAPSSAA